MESVKLHSSRTLIARGLGFVTAGGWLRVCPICRLFLQRHQGFQQHPVRHGSQHGDRDTSNGLPLWLSTPPSPLARCRRCLETCSMCCQAVTNPLYNSFLLSILCPISVLVQNVHGVACNLSHRNSQSRVLRPTMPGGTFG